MTKQLSGMQDRHLVIPAEAGIQIPGTLNRLGSRFRGNDGGGKIPNGHNN
jgi:hypothetical protein